MTLLMFIVLLTIVRLLKMVSVYIICRYGCKNANSAAAVRQISTSNYHMFIQNHNKIQANLFLNLRICTGCRSNA